MPYRITPLIGGQIYHIYNRGVERRRIFENTRDYQRFFKTLTYYQLTGPKPKFSHFNQSNPFKPNFNKKIVEVIAYCLMPNHFHLLVKQLSENGISEFVSKLTNSYTKYYNIKYFRVGPLVQGQFKAVLMENDEQLVHLSRYIHLNPLVSNITKNLDHYQWSSYQEYINGHEGICNKDLILEHFTSPQSYKQFILDQADYTRQLELIKHQILD